VVKAIPPRMTTRGVKAGVNNLTLKPSTIWGGPRVTMGETLVVRGTGARREE